MTPARVDLPTIWRGCDWGPVTFKWKDKNGQPINVQGFNARAYSLNINLNARVTNIAQGIVKLSLTREQTKSLRLGTERWDWIWERTAGNYRFPPFLTGRVPIRDPVTTIPPEVPPSNGTNDLSETPPPPELAGFIA